MVRYPGMILRDDIKIFLHRKFINGEVGHVHGGAGSCVPSAPGNGLACLFGKAWADALEELLEISLQKYVTLGVLILWVSLTRPLIGGRVSVDDGKGSEGQHVTAYCLSRGVERRNFLL